MKIIYPLLCALLILSGCNKATDATEVDEFVIYGIRNVDLGVPENNVLMLGVNQDSAIENTVTLSITGMPEGVYALFSTVTDTPNFSSQLTFNCAYDAKAGTYPIKLIGKSATFTKTYDLSITVPKMNRFNFADSIYQVESVKRSEAGHVYLDASSSGGTLQMVFPAGAMPKESGTFRIVREPAGSNEVGIYFSSAYLPNILYQSTGYDNRKAVITVDSGRIRVLFTDVEMETANIRPVLRASALVCER